jgi:hypothetical protein
MPSNKDLITSIEEEATAKGADIPDTEGKNNAELAGILKELKAKEAAAPTPPSTDDEDLDNDLDNAEAQEAADARRKASRDQAKKEDKAAKANAAPPPPKPAPYIVATGKAITCKKGVLGEGEEIKKEYLGGGKESLDNLVKKGFVIKN